MGDTSGLSVAFVAVGSNIEPQENIAAALLSLATKVRVVSSSTFYRTTPIGREDQPSFVNGIWRVDTALQPRQIRTDLLQPAERALGRRRTADKFAPRTIDLDLVLYDDLALEEPGFRLPHPDITRPFVCAPIRELLDRDTSDIDAGLRNRIAGLLPEDASHVQPGTPLLEFTKRLEQLLCEPSRRRAS